MRMRFVRPALVGLIAVTYAGCNAGPEQPIDVGAAFATAVCEGNFQDATELATPELAAGRTAPEFGDEMRFRSPCDGEVVDAASQAGIGRESAMVRTRLELDTGEVAFHEVELVETSAGWRVKDFGPYTEGWPPNQPGD